MHHLCSHQVSPFQGDCCCLSCCRTLLDTLVSLQPQRSVKAGESREDKVLNLAADVLKRVPELVDYEATYKLVSDDMGPLNVVLLQEVCVVWAGCVLGEYSVLGATDNHL